MKAHTILRVSRLSFLTQRHELVMPHMNKVKSAASLHIWSATWSQKRPRHVWTHKQSSSPSTQRHKLVMPHVNKSRDTFKSRHTHNKVLSHSISPSRSTQHGPFFPFFFFFPFYVFFFLNESCHTQRFSKSLDSMWALFFICGFCWYIMFFIICRGSKHTMQRRGLGIEIFNLFFEPFILFTTQSQMSCSSFQKSTRY